MAMHRQGPRELTMLTAEKYVWWGEGANGSGVVGWVNMNEAKFEWS